MIRNECPHCKQSYEIADEWIGKMVSCPACNRNFIIPNPNTSAIDQFPQVEKKQNATDTKRALAKPKSLWICNILLFLVLLVVGAIAFRIYCPPSPVENNTMKDELFKHNIIKLFDIGARIQTMTSYGINKVQLESEVNQLEAALNMVVATYPKSGQDRNSQFLSGILDTSKAIQGWRLTVKLWDLKVGKKDEPCEPNVNGYKAYLEYAGNDLIQREYPGNFSVAGYRGKKYLPFDDNISVMLTVSGRYYRSGINEIMKSVGAVADDAIKQ